MTDALDQTDRSALERFIQRARRLLEDDLARHAEGRFGIHATDGTIEDEDGLHLNPDDLAARRDIVDVLHFIRREEPDHPAAVSRLIREAAFTHLNRLVAIRIAEAIGLLPESIANGPASAGYRELLEVAPLLAHDASGGYWRYLQLCGDELAADLPQLFDPRNPLLELSPSPAAFDELIDLLTAAELTPVWDAPDALGWAYQFFNSGDERDAIHKRGAPRSSAELAIVNQFFTPRYVVDFLVHNSLGRRLLEADPASPLIDDLPLLLDAPAEPGEPLDLAEVRVLDPACGSGHFLLGAYDVLERAWLHAGVEPDEAAPHIVASLWGIDIDPRCAQVAAAAIILRARRACSRHDLPTPNVVCARALPEPTDGWDALLAGLPEDRRQLVDAMRDALDQAPVLGPLLKVEERLATEIRARVADADDTDGTLFAAAGVANDAFGRAEVDVLAVLSHLADQTTSSPAERLFAAEANDAIRFVESLRHRYDAVLMNPPFGSPTAGSKSALKAAYKWAPSTLDMFSLFVGRGVELCRRGGYVGAITPRSALFLSSLTRWRDQVLLGNGLVAVADLGFGVMEQALVEAAAYVVRHGRRSDGDVAAFLRLLRELDRPSALYEVSSRARANDHDDRVFRADADRFRDLPNGVISYWTPTGLLEFFSHYPSMADAGVEVRQGLASGDDFRFIRLWWEVPTEAIALGPSRSSNARWFPFAKGGEYAPVYAELPLVINWRGDGADLRAADLPGTRIQNTAFFWRPGVTWPLRTASGFGPRLLPEGCVFGHKGPSAFNGEDELLLLAWLNSRMASALLMAMLSAGDETSSGTASKSYEVGLVKSLPWPTELSDVKDQLEASLVREFSLRATLAAESETSTQFAGSPLLDLEVDGDFEGAAIRLLAKREHIVQQIIAEWEAREQLIASCLGLSEDVVEYLDAEVGPSPRSYGSSPEIVENAVALVPLALREVVSTLLMESGGSRLVATKTFIADRLLEVVAHGRRCSVDDLIEARRRLGLLPAGYLQGAAADFVSFLMGVAWGRWEFESRVAVPSSHRQWQVIPACVNEGKLDEVGEAVSSHAKSPSHFVDEPGHGRDLESAIASACVSCAPELKAWLSDAIRLLGRGSLRAYLRAAFFDHHLSRYSAGRRRGPIYWPLYVPSGKWGVWVYAPRLTRETLYVVASEALRREGHAEVEIERLERERAAGGSGRGAKALDKALDDERKLAEELRRFRQEAERIAGLGWEPDLDDGIVLCAAPLADLFPQWRKELAGYRDELRAGKYEWSTVSKWADQL